MSLAVPFRQVVPASRGFRAGSGSDSKTFAAHDALARVLARRRLAPRPRGATVGRHCDHERPSPQGEHSDRRRHNSVHADQARIQCSLFMISIDRLPGIATPWVRARRRGPGQLAVLPSRRRDFHAGPLSRRSPPPVSLTITAMPHTSTSRTWTHSIGRRWLAGAEVLTAPRDEPWGMRELGFDHPTAIASCSDNPVESS